MSFPLFGKPVSGPIFFEQVIRDNLDLGRHRLLHAAVLDLGDLPELVLNLGRQATHAGHTR